MIYKLTEEQSIEYFNNIEALLGYHKKVHTDACNILNDWYNLYRMNRNNLTFFTKLMYNDISYEKFLSIIANDTGLSLYSANEYQCVIPRRLSGWVTKLKIDKIQKLTGITLNPESINIVLHAKQLGLQHGSMWSIYEIYNKLTKYCTIPYTVDEEDLASIKNIEFWIKYYKINVY